MSKFNLLIIRILVLIYSPIVYSQTVMIEGYVTDSVSGEVLQYANVYFENLHIGTVTNSNGEYVINVKKDSLYHKLDFSYIGYKKQSFKINFKFINQRC